jgi:hypothetical protein
MKLAAAASEMGPTELSCSSIKPNRAAPYQVGTYIIKTESPKYDFNISGHRDSFYLDMQTAFY